jgi:undecaprenyl-diphosphatase
MIDSIILGLVEGATEFIPVSSTGHLLVAEHLLGAHRGEAFNVLIQVGPILASALVLRHRLARWFLQFSDPAVRAEVFQVLFAFLVTGLGGFILEKAGLKLPESILPVAVATLVGAPVIFLIERHATTHPPRGGFSWSLAIAIAAAQLLAAAFPGTSRSGACVMAGLLIGASRPAAVEFSFLVGIPTMLAAGGYKLVKEFKHGGAGELATADSVVAFAVATVVAFFVVRWLLDYVRSSTFIPFAWYRLALGIGLLAWALA